jgi:hypothetical protein
MGIADGRTQITRPLEIALEGKAVSTVAFEAGLWPASTDCSALRACDWARSAAAKPT